MILYISIYVLLYTFNLYNFIFQLYFSNQIEFDLKSINQEFILFLKLLRKHCIQYFTIKL